VFTVIGLEEAVMADQEAASGSDTSGRPLWFTPPEGAENRRRALTRERVIAEALEVIGESGVETLSMRALATRLGVVPGALYRHVRSKEQLYDLILDGVLAEVDCRADPSLALTEAFLTPLHAAGMPGAQAALAFRLIYDYTLGFALSDRTTASEQRLQDTATRRDLHAFLRSLPTDRFPVLVALGEYVWAGDRDQRFSASLHTLTKGLRATRPHDLPGGGPPD
jgi:AcrR family transcriptional regulator